MRADRMSRWSPPSPSCRRGCCGLWSQPSGRSRGPHCSSSAGRTPRTFNRYTTHNVSKLTLYLKFKVPVPGGSTEEFNSSGLLRSLETERRKITWTVRGSCSTATWSAARRTSGGQWDRSGTSRRRLQQWRCQHSLQWPCIWGIDWYLVVLYNSIKFLTWRRGQWRANRPSPGWPTAGTLSNTMAVFLHLLLLHFPLTFPVEPSHLYCTYTYTDWLTSTSLSCLFLFLGPDNVTSVFWLAVTLHSPAVTITSPSSSSKPSTKPDTVEIDADLTYLLVYF